MSTDIFFSGKLTNSTDTQIEERVFYLTNVAKHMWKQAGSNDDPCFTSILNIPVVSVENEWDMTFGSCLSTVC